jgi:hypothetical protein
MVSFQDCKDYLTGNSIVLPEIGDFLTQSLDYLLVQCSEHRDSAIEHGKSNLTDSNMAIRIMDTLDLLVKERKWSENEEKAIKICMFYFIQNEDAENDWDSPIGFDDDAQILNFCLDYLNSSLPRINLS